VEWRDAHAAGALIGERYRLIAPLARGGFGAVYEAEQITTERRVAIKLLVRQPEDISIDRMLGEARIASRLRSEHIVQVLDAGVDLSSSTVFVAMELLSGVTLLDLVEQGGARPPQETAEYIRQIASGLDKAHGHVDRDGRPSPIVHRDLKPANVFVTSRDDGSALLKILDFGTAKMLSANAPSSRIVRGTPQYMAPEQLAGDPPTPATDIWALGLVTFFVLTGRSYWMSVAKQASAEALFGEIYALPLAPASERARAVGSNAALGPAFDTWFGRCVNRNADGRFQSASVAARELANALGGTLVAPVIAAPSPEVNRTGTPSHSEEREVVSSAELAARAAASSAAKLAGPPRPLRTRALFAFLLGLALAGFAIALLMERRRALESPPQAPSGSEGAASPAAGVAVENTASSAPSPTSNVSEPVEIREPRPSAHAAPAVSAPRIQKASRRETAKTAKPASSAPPAQPTSTSAPGKNRPNVYEIR
jgi:serine/threonine-protein kinase